MTDIVSAARSLAKGSAKMLRQLGRERRSLLVRLDQIDRAMAKLVPHAPPKDLRRGDIRAGRQGLPLNSRDVLVTIASFYRTTPSKILHGDRHRGIARVRHVAMYLARQCTSESLPELGITFERDHATVRSGIAKIETAIQVDRHLAAEIELARALFQPEATEATG